MALGVGILFGILTGSVVLDLTILFSLVWFAWSLQSYLRLRHIPGPFTWAWSLWPLFKLHIDGDIYHVPYELSKKYGPLVRIAPNTLLCSDADVVRRMNSTKSPYTRAEFYISMRLTPGVDNVLSVVDDAEHDERRRKMAAGYSGKECAHLEKDIDECVLDLCNLIGTKYALDADDRTSPLQPMDLAQKIQYFTSDIMSKLSFDAKFHDLKDDNDNFGYINEIETMFPRVFCTCTIPKVLDFVTKIGLLKLFAPTANAQFGMGKILAITQRQVRARFNNEKEQIVDERDMLGSFLRHGLTLEEAEQESVMQLGAGSDTVATGLRSTLFALMSTPRAYSRLMAEIDEAMKSGKIPSEHDKVIPDAVSREMPYLQACIKEGLRWHPPIAGQLNKEVPKGGDVICGFKVPAGTGIAWSPKYIHHNPILFGPDPLAYRPERWLHISEGGEEPDRAKILAMERNNELIYGYGKYQCLGRPVATIELNKVFCELLRRFEFIPMNPMKGWESEKCFGIFIQKRFWVTVRRREIKY